MPGVRTQTGKEEQEMMRQERASRCIKTGRSGHNGTIWQLFCQGIDSQDIIKKEGGMKIHTNVLSSAQGSAKVSGGRKLLTITPSVYKGELSHI